MTGCYPFMPWLLLLMMMMNCTLLLLLIHLQKWHVDACLLLLLLAAFSAANALALLYIGMVAAGMALPTRMQQVSGQQAGREAGKFNTSHLKARLSAGLWEAGAGRDT